VADEPSTILQSISNEVAIGNYYGYRQAKSLACAYALSSSIQQPLAIEQTL
jgi:hypothetical protein